MTQDRNKGLASTQSLVECGNRIFDYLMLIRVTYIFLKKIPPIHLLITMKTRLITMRSQPNYIEALLSFVVVVFIVFVALHTGFSYGPKKSVISTS